MEALVTQNGNKATKRCSFPNLAGKVSHYTTHLHGQKTNIPYFPKQIHNLFPQPRNSKPNFIFSYNYSKILKEKNSFLSRNVHLHLLNSLNHEVMNPYGPRLPRHVRHLLWRRARGGGNSGRVSDFEESLLRGQRSDGTWCDLNPEEVPRGYVPVYVGSEEKRFVVPMVYLSTPDFRELMGVVAEEFGFEQEGVLKIPCEEDEFEEILYKCLARHKAKSLTWKK